MALLIVAGCVPITPAITVRATDGWIYSRLVATSERGGAKPQRLEDWYCWTAHPDGSRDQGRQTPRQSLTICLSREDALGARSLPRTATGFLWLTGVERFGSEAPIDFRHGDLVTGGCQRDAPLTVARIEGDLEVAVDSIVTVVRHGSVRGGQTPSSRWRNENREWRLAGTLRVRSPDPGAPDLDQGRRAAHVLYRLLTEEHAAAECNPALFGRPPSTRPKLDPPERQRVLPPDM